MFGGWTAALLLKSMIEHAEYEGSPAALSINFIGRISPGEQLRIKLTPTGSTQSLAHWRSDLHGETGFLLASATAVFARRRPSDRAGGVEIPGVAPPDDLPVSNPPGRFGQHTETRTAYGLPPFRRPDLRSLAWVRETSGRAVDHAQLAYLSDVYAPRVFHISEAPRPSSTIVMSVHFLADPDELASIGDDHVLVDAAGTRIEHSIAGSRASLFSRSGSLLATSEQLCWFR
jgi:acyl-CoA thioesterase